MLRKATDVSKGRTVPIYRPGVNRAGEVTIPACDLTLPDGRLLVYRGRTAPQSVGGGATLTLSGWHSADGLAVCASIDRLPHLTIKSKLGFLHLSISRDDRYPTWEEMVQVAEVIAGPGLDMAMIKPRRSDYVNVHVFTMHWWEMPVEWGVQ
jgi:hypothetical protein